MPKLFVSVGGQMAHEEQIWSAVQVGDQLFPRSKIDPGSQRAFVVNDRQVIVWDLQDRQHQLRNVGALFIEGDIEPAHTV